MLSGEDPIIITNSSESLFEPIKTQSASVKIVSNDYLFNLYNAGYNVPVTIYQIDNSNNSSGIIFVGYVTPNIYNQTWEYVDEIEIQCVSDIAMLKYRDYETSSKQIKSMYEIVKKCLSSTRYNTLRFISSAEYSYMLDENTGQATDYILNHIYLDEMNFFDDNEEQTPWKYYDVLEEIMKIMCCSLVETCGVLTMIHYNNDLLDDRNISVYDFSDDSTYKETEVVEPKVITDDLYFSSDNNISLDETYKKIKVKANTYPYDEVFNEIMDADNWELHSLYGTQGSLISNNNDMPLLTWTFDNKTYNHLFYLYYQSDYITPYLYGSQGINPPYFENNTWMPVLIDDDNPQNPGETAEQNLDRYKIGSALMKNARYNTERYNVVSKLDWKPQIVFYTGVNNFNISNYTSVSPSKNSSDLLNDVSTYIKNICSQTAIYATSNYLPPKPLLLIQSTSDINISTNSYLVINGQLMVNDLEWEDSVENEWTGSDNFSNPIVYRLIDQIQDFGVAGSIIGFPLLRIQVRVGQPNQPQNHYILCRVVENRQDPQPDGRVRTYTEVTYHWKSVSELSGISGRNPYQPYLDIPVGVDKWGFYKFYEITNTCDWRLGLDDATGFALPLPEKVGSNLDHRLTGKLMIYIMGPSEQLYGRYVKNILDLPTTITTYEVNRNPNNIWSNSGWTSDDNKTVTIKYEGTLPNNIVAKDLKFEIKEVIYHNYSDTAKSNADNKKTDQEYENIINDESVVDVEDIECKINTQDQSKCRSFSSMMFKDSNNDFQYITKMGVDDSGEMRIQENNIIQTYKDHYSSPKVKFDCDLKNHFGIYPGYDFLLPLPQFYLYNSILDKNMFINGFEFNLKNADYKMNLIEY